MVNKIYRILIKAFKKKKIENKFKVRGYENEPFFVEIAEAAKKVMDRFGLPELSPRK